MFARLVARARSLFSQTPSDQDTTAIQAAFARPDTGLDDAMPTKTRRAEAVEAEQRSKRALDAFSSPEPDAKRRRHSTDDEDRDDEDTSREDSKELLDTIVVDVQKGDYPEGRRLSLEEQLLKAAQGEDAPPEGIALRSHRELSKEDVGEAADSAVNAFVHALPVTRRQALGHSTRSLQTSEELRSPTVSSRLVDESLPKRASKKSADSIAKATDVASTSPKRTPAPSANRKHIRFGSEEAEVSSPAVLEHQSAPAEEDLSSDDDEAPEAITQASAVQQTKSAAAEASKAIDEAVAALERKHQERAARRAEEQTQKKQRQEKLKKKAQRRDRLHASKVAQVEANEPDLPDLLPESILAAAPEKRPATPPPGLIDTSAQDREVERRNRHIKFLEKSEKRVKDVKRGPVHMRVLSKPNELLAPKVNRSARNIREHWLGARAKEKIAGSTPQMKANGKLKGNPKGRWDHAKLERKSFGGSFLRTTTDI